MLSILLSVFLMVRDRDSRRLGNYLQLVQHHRDVWKMALELEDLDRITTREPVPRDALPSPREAQFLTFVFLHMTGSFELAKYNQIISIEQFRFDVTQFLATPVVASFWRDRKKFYNRDFAAFVDSCLEHPGEDPTRAVNEPVSHSEAAARAR